MSKPPPAASGGEFTRFQAFRRATRSGKVFSPFDLHVHAVPIQTDIDIADYLTAENLEQESGYVSEFDDPESDLSDLEDLSDSDPLEAKPESARPTTPPRTSETRPSKKARRKDFSRAKRRVVRQDNRKERIAAGKAGLKAVSLLRASYSKPLPTELDATVLPASSTAWTATRTEPEKRTYTLKELTGSRYGMQVVDWDGRTSRPILDRHRRVIGALGGTPKEGWGRVASHATGAIRESGTRCSFSAKKLSSRRGNFATLAVGVSFGGGQKVPLNVRNSARNARALRQLLMEESIVRISGFSNCLFEAFAPAVFRHYGKTMEALYQSDPSLSRNFDNSAFAATTFNFGPQTTTFPHRDSANLSWGWCAITALGDFDPDLGGHLVLWDLRLIIRFPPGSTVLIPSALLRHSNIPVQPGETRYSCTQYSAGGLFRWVYNGFMSDKTFDERPQPVGEEERLKREEELAARAADSAKRWRDGLDMFYVWNTL